MRLRDCISTAVSFSIAAWIVTGIHNQETKRIEPKEQLSMQDVYDTVSAKEWRYVDSEAEIMYDVLDSFELSEDERSSLLFLIDSGVEPEDVSTEFDRLDGDVDGVLVSFNYDERIQNEVLSTN